MITAKDIIDSCGKFPERAAFASDEVRANAAITAAAYTRLETSFGRPIILSSGFRPQHVNAKTIGASANSLHLKALAGDAEDQDRELAIFCLSDLALLVHFGLYLEDPRYSRRRHPDTKKWMFWVHLQVVPPPSGKRVFIPHNGPIPR
jgi:hypothetical protein